MANTTIKRNGKTYFKSAKYPYIYKGTDGKFIYRLIHKESKTDTYVVKNNLTNEKFTSAQEAIEDRQRRLYELGDRKNTEYDLYTVGKIWEEMLSKTTDKSEGTIRKHTSVYNHHIKSVFETTKLKDLVVGDINELLVKLYKYGDGSTKHEGGYKYTFVESILKWFYWFYNFCYGQGYIKKAEFDNFFELVKMPSKKKNLSEDKLRILTNDEISQILKMLRGSDLFIPTLISLTTGLRPAECFALTWDDIDFKSRTLHVNQKISEENGGKLVLSVPKTAASIRPVDIPEVLLNELYEHKRRIHEAKIKDPITFESNKKNIVDERNLERKIIDMPDFVCVDLYGRYIKPSAFKYWSKKIRAEICPNIDGVEDFSFYTFRKTHISKMAAYLPELALIQHTGHAKVDTIRKYYAGRSDEVEKAIRNTVGIVGSGFSEILDQADDYLDRNPSKRYQDPRTNLVIEDTEIKSTPTNFIPKIDSDDIDF